MKVWLYAIRLNTGWVMNISLARKLDAQYWKAITSNTVADSPHDRCHHELLRRSTHRRWVRQAWFETKVGFQVGMAVVRLFEKESSALPLDHWQEEEWEQAILAWIRKAQLMLGQQGHRSRKRVDIDHAAIRVSSKTELDLLEVDTCSDTNGHHSKKRSCKIAMFDWQEGVSGAAQRENSFEWPSSELDWESSRLSQQLCGRALFESELLSMLSGKGAAWSKGQLHAVIQWGLLNGSLTVHSGVTWPLLEEGQGSMRRNAGDIQAHADSTGMDKGQIPSGAGGRRDLHRQGSFKRSFILVLRQWGLFPFGRASSLTSLCRLVTSGVRQWSRMLWRREKQQLPYCLRCGALGDELQVSACESCGSSRCYTCMACLQLARSRSCALLVSSTWGERRHQGLNDVRHQQVYKWDDVNNLSIYELDTLDLDQHQKASGSPAESSVEVEALLEPYHLAPAQWDASRGALQYLSSRLSKEHSSQGQFLLWAVTGAGKTEMMFPMTAFMLANKKKVCIATPRKDVVLELMPRIKKAFPEAKVVTLYGGSEERFESGEITLTTTHQLLRFRDAFDLMVVDELDAFPYHNNPMLERAAKLACKGSGTFVYLSATPPSALARAARRGQLAQATVPVRYHRHPLPVPKRLPMPPVARMIASGRLPSRVVGALHHAVLRGAQLFIFVARIRHIDGAVALLRKSFPQQAIAGTSAADAKRAEKVLAFRSGEIRILVTTTILERGVTVPKSDVFIWDADNKLFDEASLVQMAGRAGRSKDDPNGSVYFGSSQWTRSQSAATRQIRRMNRLAKRGGYLLAK